MFASFCIEMYLNWFFCIQREFKTGHLKLLKPRCPVELRLRLWRGTTLCHCGAQHGTGSDPSFAPAKQDDGRTRFINCKFNILKTVTLNDLKLMKLTTQDTALKTSDFEDFLSLDDPEPELEARQLPNSFGLWSNSVEWGPGLCPKRLVGCLRMRGQVL